MTNAQRERFDVFISFAPGEDGKLPPIDFIWDALVQLAGRDLDIRSSQPLPDGRGSVDLAIGRAAPEDADVFVAVLSPGYLAARQGHMETARFARACSSRPIPEACPLFAVVHTPVDRAQIPVHFDEAHTFEMFGTDQVSSEAAINAAVFGLAIKACDALDEIRPREGATTPTQQALSEPAVKADTTRGPSPTAGPKKEEDLPEPHPDDPPEDRPANGGARSEKAYVYVYYEASDSIQARTIAKQLMKKQCHSLFPYWESKSTKERDDREQEVLGECKGVAVIAGEVDFLPWIEGLRHALIRAGLDEKLPLVSCMFPPLDDEKQSWNQTDRIYFGESLTRENVDQLAKFAESVHACSRTS